MKASKKPTTVTRTLTITKKDYERELASGVASEDAMKPGKHHFRRATRFANPEDLEKRNIKMTVSIRLDGDIVEFFKLRAAAPNTAPYQTQINTALREYMDGRQGGDVDINKLLRNEKLIAAIAQRVREMV